MNDEMKKIIEVMIQNRRVRKAITTRSHLMFFGTYFGHYMEYDFAPFHRDMFTLTEDENIQTLVVTAARNTGKSTIMNLSYTIWSILGKHKSQFIVILSQTQAKSKQHYTNIRKELEENKRLRSDLGPFQEDSSEWGASLVIPRYDARIMFASTEQSMRGLRHKQHRPDLIIADDLEDNDSVKTYDGRNKVYDWLTKDVIPAGSSKTRLVVLGTLLHEDSIMMRLKKEIEQGTRDGVYKEYPLINAAGIIQWPAKYPDEESVEAERRRIGDEKAWFQEFLLRIISDADRIFHPEWIQYYKELPERDFEKGYRGMAIGIDLAISERERADYTAMVAMAVYGWGEEMKIYVLPNPVNERLNFPAALEKAQALSSTEVGESDRKAKMFVESNQYQQAFPEMMQKLRYPAEGIQSRGDKRSRLAMTNLAVKEGQVLFPEKGAEMLIQQLIGFGVERHDDLADAFAIVLLQILKGNGPSAGSFSRLMKAYNSIDFPKPITAGLLYKRF